MHGNRRWARRVAIAMATAMLAASVASPAGASEPVTTIEPGVLKVCLYPGFAPFVVQGKAGWSGWDVDYLTQFAQGQGLRLEPVAVQDYRDIWMRPGRGECDIAATGITRTDARVRQAGPAATWSARYTSVARALIVREGTVIRGIRDLAGKKVAVTKGSTADVDLLSRLRKAGITSTTVRYVDSEQRGARLVARGGPGAPIAYAGGAGSIEYLTGELRGLRTTWVHCLMLPDGTVTSEPFSFVVRTASTGLAGALDAFITSSGVPYPGGPGTGRDCPRSAR